MCGICGVYFDSSAQAVEQGRLDRMLQAIHHRGPDDERILIDKNFWARGSSALSIIDLDTGHQPMTNEDSSVVVVCNGEIYNYKELKAALVKKGHQFRSTSDTEVIVHLYEDYGEKFVTRLRGMFGIVIWDVNKRKLLLAPRPPGHQAALLCPAQTINFYSGLRSKRSSPYPGFEKKTRPSGIVRSAQFENLSRLQKRSLMGLKRCRRVTS